MADSLPPVPPQNSHDNAGKSQPANESKGNPPDNAQGSNLDWLWFLLTVGGAAIEGGLAWFFWWFADPLEEHGYYKVRDCSQFLAGIFILVAICHAVFRVWKLARPATAKKVWYGFGGGAFLLTAAFAYICWPSWRINQNPITQPNPPDFAISGSWVENDMTPNMKPYCWIVEGGYVTSIPSAIKVSFVNLQDVSVMINSYALEGQKTNGAWESIDFQNRSYPVRVFWGTDFKKVIEYRYETFDSAIQRKNIGAHETVEGWIFLIKQIADYQAFRFTFRDSMGHSHQQLMAWLESINWPAQPPMMEETSNEVDISGLPQNK